MMRSGVKPRNYIRPWVTSMFWYPMALGLGFRQPKKAEWYPSPRSLCSQALILAVTLKSRENHS